MALPTWPAAPFPQFVLRQGFQEGFKDLVKRTPMDTGAPKKRKRFSAGEEKNVYPVELDSDQVDEFKTWYYNTVAGGALNFTKINPRTGNLDEYAFRGNVPPMTPSGYNSYIINLPLDLQE